MMTNTTTTSTQLAANRLKKQIGVVAPVALPNQTQQQVDRNSIEESTKDQAVKQKPQLLGGQKGPIKATQKVILSNTNEPVKVKIEKANIIRQSAP